jgi:SAM-dependent methyltransferase
LGVGTGGHAKVFKAKGFEVIGIERSPEMVQLAKENGIECVVGDISQVKLERQFDTALSLFHVISYLTDPEGLRNTFRLTHEHLKEGGVFIFDAWYSDAVEVQKPERREKLIEHEEFKVRRVAQPTIDPAKHVVHVGYEFSLIDSNGKEVDRWQEDHPMRHFSISEIKSLAKSIGFELLHAEEYLTGATPSVNTWGVCFILRKSNIGKG